MKDKKINLTFNGIDVETANSNRSSICQIGIVHVVEGKIVDTWQTLVNPEDWFDPMNVSIHRITERDVRESPTMPEIRQELRRRLRGQILVSHTSFDRVAFERAMNKYDLEQLQVAWLDSARIVRRAWPQYSQRGYGLKNVASDLGIQFKHHDALEDAKAAAQITVIACRESGFGVDRWVRKLPVPEPNSVRAREKMTYKGIAYEDLDGVVEELRDHSLVFTGTLRMTRSEATTLATSAGCTVTSSVTQKTSVLVVGIQDEYRLNGYKKSSKHRKAEQLIAEGNEIQIISEQDFTELIKTITNA